ncbi:hypothetical protein NSK_005335 [Nannochloropsis salina CCMP1776]|uniref:Uncharacterized protein n=1 Tax=Nannochloropsis salina CCMP1776 TaxID=1027361 RepID=A0A4D9D1L4_9STRA|nr:hypothetical protein NSK_005335 [Nannochloropsis salina CCMP1776]|eukprot:TFJ83365.1 hypothetical protein NSK_005335 [Nannochloropsis salina CCMP1776]
MRGGTDEQQIKKTNKNVLSSNKIIDAKQETEEEEADEQDDDADKHCFGKEKGWGNNDFQSKQDEGDGDREAEGKELELLVDGDGRLVFDGGHVDFSFRSFPAAFPCFCTDATSSSVLSTLLHDCRLASTARAQAKAGGDYSEGETFFITADTEPKVQLEALALSIFRAHTTQAAYAEGQSGAEWWVQVLEEEDDIGLHFDKDYALEAHGLNIYPHLATVTYLSSLGGPTLVLPLSGPLHVGEDLSGALSGAWLSLPAVGKHTVFDGRLLHAAPAELRGLWADGDGLEEGDGGDTKSIFQGIGAVLGVAGATALVVRTFDQTEIKYIESKAAAEIARVEDKRTMSEMFWKAEVERFKREVQLAYTQDYEPYQAALVDKRKKRGGTGGLEEKEEEN